MKARHSPAADECCRRALSGRGGWTGESVLHPRAVKKTQGLLRLARKSDGDLVVGGWRPRRAAQNHMACRRNPRRAPTPRRLSRRAVDGRLSESRSPGIVFKGGESRLEQSRSRRSFEDSPVPDDDLYGCRRNPERPRRLAGTLRTGTGKAVSRSSRSVALPRLRLACRQRFHGGMRPAMHTDHHIIAAGGLSRSRRKETLQHGDQTRRQQPVGEEDSGQGNHRNPS